nr:nitrite reductase [Nocardioides daedukensis]
MVRLRLIGGVVAPASLLALMAVADEFGDGTIHLTKRANLQLRGLPATDGCLDAEVVAAIEGTGLLPSPSHELVRNVLVSPLTGLLGGRVDLRPIAAALDEGLCADPVFAGLSARFLFVLDDGRGDVVGRSCDLGLVALDDSSVQIRVGDAWGPVLALDGTVPHLLGLARDFVSARGTGPDAPWHVRELAAPLGTPEPRDPRADVHGEPPAYGTLAPGLEHVQVAEGLLNPEQLATVLAPGPNELVVTPWRSILVRA